MTTLLQASEDYALVEKAIRFLELNIRLQPSLADVAAHVGLSAYHFQRLFTRWAGISPKRFLQFLTKENAKALLARTSILSAAYETGLTSASRLHDLFIQAEAVTPGEYKSRGVGLELAYGFHPTPFGECLLALSSRGICFLGFVENDQSAAMEILKYHWMNAALHESKNKTAPVIEKIFSPRPDVALTVHLSGTNFQLKVWEALLRLSPGQVVSYQGVAQIIGDDPLPAPALQAQNKNIPIMARAIGNALGQNPVAYLIPCHRVLRQVGEFGEYRYGSARKKAILLYESANSWQSVLT